MSSIKASFSALEEDPLPPNLPIIAISASLEISKLLSNKKNEPKPPIGLEVFLGRVIADVMPFALFHGIKTELGLKASCMLKPMLYIDASSSLVTLKAPISTIPNCVSGAINPGVIIFPLAS